jgi:hypothetical protein
VRVHYKIDGIKINHGIIYPHTLARALSLIINGDKVLKQTLGNSGVTALINAHSW